MPVTFHELPRNRLYATVAGLMLTLLLSALDQTIVGTAMPRIISDLHGFERYAWVTTAYLLTSTTVVPIVGKLSDMYGYKVFMVGGTAFFLLASMLCGISQDMNQLIVFRGLQGVGGGVLTATVFTVISAIFPPAQRGRIQGVFGGVFGLASVVGPLVGGYLTDSLSWRWVFYVNLPIGILALAVLWIAFPHIRPEHRKRSIDYLGAITLVAGVTPLLLALSLGGRDYAWTSPQVLGLVGFALAMLAIFAVVELRAPEPIMPPSLLRNRIVAASTAALALMSIGMFGTILFIPLFIQGVIGTNATTSGTVLTPMMLTMVAASITAGQIVSRTGRYRIVGLAGMSMTLVAMLLLAGMGPDTDYATVVRNMMLLGLGLGPTMPVFTLAAQNAVTLRELGVVTSFTQFFRSIGGTLGAAIFGSVLSNQFGPALRVALPAPLVAAVPPERLAQFENPQALLNPEAAQAMRAGFSQFGPQGAQMVDALLGSIKIALASSLHDVFLLGSGVVAIGVVVVFFLKEIPLKKTYGRTVSPGTEVAVPAPQAAIAEAPTNGRVRRDWEPAGMRES